MHGNGTLINYGKNVGANGSRVYRERDNDNIFVLYSVVSLRGLL